MAEGNTLGPRRYFRYVTDKNVNYKYQTDLNLGTAAGATLNDTDPNLPRRFEPRYLNLQAEINGEQVRKKLIVPNVTSAAWTDTPVEVEIDGEIYTTTGRVGERVSFGVNPGVAAPVP